MPFTEEERQAWFAEKKARELRARPQFRAGPAAICGHCGTAFGAAEGNANSEFPLCDVCNGD